MKKIILALVLASSTALLSACGGCCATQTYSCCTYTYSCCGGADAYYGSWW